MSYITTTVDIDVDDILCEVSDEDLREELRKRDAKRGDLTHGQYVTSERDLLERVYYDVRGNCPSDALREYLSRVTGRVC